MTDAGAVAPPCPEDGEPTPGAIVRVLEIINKKGLHARASAKFVQTVERFTANVKVTRGGETVGGDSIMGLMMLSAAPGTTITVEAVGGDAPPPVETLAGLGPGGVCGKGRGGGAPGGRPKPR